MPSETERQRKFMGAELGRLREGKKTQTGMSEEKLKEFASKPLAKGGPGSGRGYHFVSSADKQYKRLLELRAKDDARKLLAKQPIQKEFFDHMEKTYGFEVEKGGMGSGKKGHVSWSNLHSTRKFRYPTKKEKDGTFDTSSHFAGESHGHSTPIGYPPKNKQ